MWRWYAGWGVLTMVGVVVSQILCGDHSLLLICVSGNSNCFLCYRWGLLVPCALEKYSEAPVVVTFCCGPRIFAEFWMVAFALCSATSFVVFYIFSAWGWMQEFTFLTCYAVSTRLFFFKLQYVLIYLCHGLHSLFLCLLVVAVVASLLVGSS